MTGGLLDTYRHQSPSIMCVDKADLSRPWWIQQTSPNPSVQPGSRHDPVPRSQSVPSIVVSGQSSAAAKGIHARWNWNPYTVCGTRCLGSLPRTSQSWNGLDCSTRAEWQKCCKDSRQYRLCLFKDSLRQLQSRPIHAIFSTPFVAHCQSCTRRFIHTASNNIVHFSSHFS